MGPAVIGMLRYFVVVVVVAPIEQRERLFIAIIAMILGVELLPEFVLKSHLFISREAPDSSVGRALGSRGRGLGFKFYRGA